MSSSNGMQDYLDRFETTNLMNGWFYESKKRLIKNGIPTQKALTEELRKCKGKIKKSYKVIRDLEKEIRDKAKNPSSSRVLNEIISRKVMFEQDLMQLKQSETLENNVIRYGVPQSLLTDNKMEQAEETIILCKNHLEEHGLSLKKMDNLIRSTYTIPRAIIKKVKPELLDQILIFKRPGWESAFTVEVNWPNYGYNFSEKDVFLITNQEKFSLSSLIGLYGHEFGHIEHYIQTSKHAGAFERIFTNYTTTFREALADINMFRLALDISKNPEYNFQKYSPAYSFQKLAIWYLMERAKSKKDAKNVLINNDYPEDLISGILNYSNSFPGKLLAYPFILGPSILDIIENYGTTDAMKILGSVFNLGARKGFMETEQGIGFLMSCLKTPDKMLKIYNKSYF